MTYRIVFDTLLGGWSIEELHTLKRGAKVWRRISNHNTLEDARVAHQFLTIHGAFE